MKKPRIVVFAYSEVGYECLRLLIERRDNVVALVTHEDNPSEKIWFKTPAMAAREAGIPVHTPPSVNSPEWVDRIASWKPDLILSFYYRHMISTRILALARLGAFNMHGSLLPKFRGRAPLNWAIVKGASESGMTLHRMVKSADAGAIVDQEAVAIDARDTAEGLFRKVLPLARRVLERQIDALLAGTAPEREQDHAQATYFGARTPADGLIDWTLPSREIFNLIRAVTDPFPGAFTYFGDKRLMVWWAEVRPEPPVATPGTILSTAPLLVATADGALELTRVSWLTDPAQLSVGSHFLTPRP
ncbi:MAG: formyltransferase [Opitutaceae bacterium]|nr:formyltransferase [Opitutaceae bacterium]